MPANSAQINFKAKAFVDRPAVMRKIDRWTLDQLARIGAYSRGIMRNQIRPALKGRKADRTINIYGTPGVDLPANWKGPTVTTCFVPAAGQVIDTRTQRPVSARMAAEARMGVRSQLAKKGSGEGSPPRRGPTDKLRKFMIFEVDVQKKSVVIGPAPFPRQPLMQGRVTVPELLNKGGVEIILGQPVKYGPRPYVETILKPAIAKLKQNIRAKPISERI